jgi:hypothetical protein
MDDPILEAILKRLSPHHADPRAGAFLDRALRLWKRGISEDDPAVLSERQALLAEVEATFPPPPER